MSDLRSLLYPAAVLYGVQVGCRREALAVMAEQAAIITGLACDEILSTILEREHLGSTGVGSGTAIPHGKLVGLDGVIGLLARLDTPVSFEAMDDQKVDLVFMLLAPEKANAAHLKSLSRVARFLRDEGTRKALRGATSAEALYAIATCGEKSDAA